MIFYIQNGILMYTPQGKLIKMYLNVAHKLEFHKCTKTWVHKKSNRAMKCNVLIFKDSIIDKLRLVWDEVQISKRKF